jgi:ABC-type amino acid transport system permease subunit
MAESNSSSGIGIGTIVFLIFLVLKLAEIGPVAKWSWWWVTFPLYAPLIFVIFMWIFLLFIRFLINNVK